MDPDKRLEELTRGMYFDKRGREISITKAGRLKYGSGRDYARVRLTVVDGIEVSTVWLGLDHDWRSPPVIFETMVFVGDMDKAITDHPLDRACWRYTSLRAAESGHRQVVRLVRAFQRRPLHLAKPHKTRNRHWR